MSTYDTLHIAEQVEVTEDCVMVREGIGSASSPVYSGSPQVQKCGVERGTRFERATACLEGTNDVTLCF